METHTETRPAVDVRPKLEEIAAVVDDVADAIPEGARAALGGDWLGHPLHPALTDLPIGFWTSSFVLDLLGGRRSRRVSAAFIGLGLAAAAPTIASGLVEFRKLRENPAKRKTAVLHLLSNAFGTFLYTWSFGARLRGKRGKGVFLGFVAAGAMTVGGYLGGHLAFGSDESDEAVTEGGSESSP